MGSKSIQSSKYDGRYFKFTVTQSGTSTTVTWKFEVLGGNDEYYSTSPINCYINGVKVCSYSATSWSTGKFPAAKGSKTDTYNVGGYGDFTITLSGRPYYSSAGTSVNGTVTLDKPTYKISYNANGGSGAPSSQTKTYGTTLKLSNVEPTRKGYTFLGWSTSSTATSATYSAGGSYKTNDSDILYAVWEVNTYTITYNANGGSDAPSAQTYTYASSGSVNLSITTPKRTGYTFLGWSLSNTATTSTYYAGQAWLRSNASNYILYAVWELKTYTITYNGNGGSGVPSSQTKTYGVNLKLSATIPTRSGYKFLGWDTDSTVKTPTYISESTFTSNGDTTLYAIWEQLGIAYINVDGTFQAGKVWVNDYGTWMSGIIFVNDNGTWTQGGI